MSIRAVFFDLGGVLLRTEYQAPRQHLAERFGMDYEDIEQIVFWPGGVNGSAARATLGEITEEEHWHNVMRMLKQPVSEYKNFEREFFGGDILDRTLIQFIRSLRPKYKTGLISNAWSGLRSYVVREKFDDAFDYLIISSEVGVAKPEAEIFQIALKQLGVRPSEAIFVDDVLENVEACRKIGMYGIQFKDSQKVIKQIQALL
jgi:epoxide hydrolase-like predicted phosphatase